MRILTDLNENAKLDMSSYKSRSGIEKFKEGSPTDLNFWRVLMIVVCGFLAPMIQEAFFNDMRIFGVKPNIAMVVVFIFSVVMNERSAMVFGAVEGLYVDLIFGKTLGIFGLLFTLTAFFGSFVLKGRFKTVHALSLAVAPGVFTVYTLAESLLSRISHLINRTGTSTVLYADFWKHLAVRILPVALYDLIICAVMIYPIRLLWKLVARKRNRQLKFEGRNEQLDEV